MANAAVHLGPVLWVTIPKAWFNFRLNTLTAHGFWDGYSLALQQERSLMKSRYAQPCDLIGLEDYDLVEGPDVTSHRSPGRWHLW